MKPNTHLNVPVDRTVDAIFVRASSDPETGCWNWQLSLNTYGYGRAWESGKCVPAHRWAYEIFNGPVASGMHIDHLCRNRRCVNPAHLRVVTPRVNALENSNSESAKNAAKRNCPKCGGPYTRTKSGRDCIPCGRKRALDSYYRRKGRIA